MTTTNPTIAGSKRGTDRASARNALAPFVEAGLSDDDAAALSTYAWLDTNGHKIAASTIDLGLEF